MIPYSRQNIDNDDIAAVTNVLKGEWLTGGPSVAQFENDIKSACGCDDVVAVSSGTAALHCAYAAIGIQPGDEVITTPLTFVATMAAALNLGAIPRFVDIDEYLMIDSSQLEDVISPKTKVVTAVDFSGQPCDFNVINKLAEKHGFTVVEDAAHSLGASLDGRPAGSLAEYAILSFHPVKAITTGEGGAVCVTGNGSVDRVKKFRNHGMERNSATFQLEAAGPWHQEVHEFGLNYRMPDILAALGSSQLSKLSRFIEERTRIATRYTELFAEVDGVQTPMLRPGATSAWHLYPLRIKEGRRGDVFSALQAADIKAQVHYLPIHLNPAFKSFGFREGMFPVAENVYKELLSIPLYPGLTDSEQDQVVEVITGVLK